MAQPSPDPVRPASSAPVGETIVGKDEDELVELTNAHLTEQHDGRTYDRDMILMMADLTGMPRLLVASTTPPRRRVSGR